MLGLLVLAARHKGRRGYGLGKNAMQCDQHDDAVERCRETDNGHGGSATTQFDDIANTEFMC